MVDARGNLKVGAELTLLNMQVDELRGDLDLLIENGKRIERDKDRVLRMILRKRRAITVIEKSE